MYFEHTSVFPMRKSKFYSWLESVISANSRLWGIIHPANIWQRILFLVFQPIWKAESAKLWVRVFMTLTDEVIILRFSTWKWFILVGCWGKWGGFVLFFKGRLHYLMTVIATFGEGNDNPLQYSCLENPKDGGAWWAAVSGVAQSQTRLKRPSSSSSTATFLFNCSQFWSHHLCFHATKIVCVRAQSLSLTLCSYLDCSPPGFFVHGISQARILEQVSISSARGSSQPTSVVSPVLVGRFFTIAPPWKPTTKIVF